MDLILHMPDWVREAAKELCFAPDQPLFMPGDCAERVYFLLQGRADIWCMSPQGQRVQLQQQGPGSCVGEMEALTGHALVNAVTAVTSCRCLALPADTFLQWARADADLAWQLMRYLAHTALEFGAFAAVGISGQLAQKVAYLLLYSPDGQQTRAQLLARTGASGRNLNRVLRRLQQLGCISAGGTVVRVCDREALFSVYCSDR
ncbi:Crp/Fnr family transcriptional regulator [Neobittarella massiliensis]|uniref:Crp/Fnr family transcriptional regulator n=1 Tax=Neobittarella massiliensis (ex Bilen et al. 2018) TaxID=2041842 RepID=A0A8J6INH8_9FIRM|nr:Crp/Fnr family transcriptional regulator [Neobittarella massiliensis]MBC3516849.1 Crp/Fnr family transcriptional regulator [Neobittarella massiliensis]